MKWLVVLVALVGLGGCVRVQAHQRGTLAKPKMQLGREPQAAEMEQHVYESREGSTGGASSGGGGCGCN